MVIDPKFERPERIVGLRISPGLPAVVVGSNTYVAWTFTNGYIDSADWRIHTACGGANADPSTCVKPVAHVETIRIAESEKTDT